ncbi:serine protease snake-like [Culex pipiens pallens]|uniref:serine protease snake-like n=1 Tax=Culex pipiens pallens TaxID=42434 RepID=UPI001953AEEB|nr:serine protease snake-like [Culex pipiens pallens]
MLATAITVRLLLYLVFALDGIIPASTQRVAERKCQEFLAKNTKTTLSIPLSLHAEIITLTTRNCSDSVDLIINGEEAARGEFPHQALLGYPVNDTAKRYEFRCGGSLISERFVLTAAHCGTPRVVRLGEHSLSEVEDEEDFEVEAFFKHPNYTVKASYHDIAVVKLVELVEFDYYVRPACLWTSVPLNLSSVIATGFGVTEFAGNTSDVLMKVRLQLRDRSSCAEKFEFERKFKLGVREEQLCVGSQKDGKDTCQGDSGGPIQVVTDGRTCMYHIVGVTSLGVSCGVGKAENIYTQVASYLDWIEDTVWPGERRTAPQRFPDHVIYFPEDDYD